MFHPSVDPLIARGGEARARVTNQSHRSARILTAVDLLDEDAGTRGVTSSLQAECLHRARIYTRLVYIYIWKRMRLVTSKRVQSGEESRIDGQTGRTVTEDEGNGDERGLCTLA